MIGVLKRWIGAAINPLFRALIRRLPIDDPWERLDLQPALSAYGSGARHEFAHYLTGPSTVSAPSIEAIKDWLLGCTYEKDEVLFSESDFWQHPATFERLRAGDCEDFAIWAWRKLVELGIDADFVAGWCLKGDELDGRHAWVVFRDAGTEFLFEAVARDRDQMVRPLAEVRHLYIPQFGADRTGKRFGFSGYLLGEKKLLQARDRKRTALPPG